MGENPAGQRGKYALVLAGVGHADSGGDLKLPSYGGSLTSVPEDFQRASGKPFGAPAGAYPCPGWGLTRRLRRGWWGCRPEGDSTFFRRERKYQRKHAARRLREKGFYCPFWRRGSQGRAQWSWIAITYVWSALVLAFFRRQNGRAFFPPLPIAARLPRSWRWADSKESQLGCYGVD